MVNGASSLPEPQGAHTQRVEWRGGGPVFPEEQAEAALRHEFGDGVFDIADVLTPERGWECRVVPWRMARRRVQWSRGPVLFLYPCTSMFAAVRFGAWPLSHRLVDDPVGVRHDEVAPLAAVVEGTGDERDWEALRWPSWGAAGTAFMAGGWPGWWAEPILRWAAVPTGSLKGDAGRGDVLVAAALAPSLSAAEQAFVAAGSNAVRVLLAGRGDLCDDVAEVLAADVEEGVRAQVARNTGVPDRIRSFARLS